MHESTCIECKVREVCDDADCHERNGHPYVCPECWADCVDEFYEPSNV